MRLPAAKRIHNYSTREGDKLQRKLTDFVTKQKLKVVATTAPPRDAKIRADQRKQCHCHEHELENHARLRRGKSSQVRAGSRSETETHMAQEITHQSS